MDNVLIVVDDLEAAKAFFAELGMELEGEAPVKGRWVDRVVGLNNVRADIAMMRTPDGHSRVELTKFHTPPAVRAEPESAPANTLGIRRIMFAVDDIDDVVARLRSHGAELVGEIAQYEDIYRLCFLRGPEGIIIGLAEQLGDLVGGGGNGRAVADLDVERRRPAGRLRADDLAEDDALDERVAAQAVGPVQAGGAFADRVPR